MALGRLDFHPARRPSHRPNFRRPIFHRLVEGYLPHWQARPCLLIRRWHPSLMRLMDQSFPVPLPEPCPQRADQNRPLWGFPECCCRLRRLACRRSFRAHSATLRRDRHCRAD